MDKSTTEFRTGMARRHLFILLTMLLFNGVGSAETTNVITQSSIKRGDSKVTVDRLLGPSKGWKSFNEETAYYDRGYVLFRDGAAVKWSIKSDDELSGQTSVPVYTSCAVPQSSPAERAERERLFQQQQAQRAIDEATEMALYQKRRAEQTSRPLSPDDERGIAIYQKNGLGRKEYEEDAAFLRNLLSESKATVGRAQPTDLANIFGSQRFSVDLNSVASPLETPPNPRRYSPDALTGDPFLSKRNTDVGLGDSLNGTLLPGAGGGMVIGGPLNGSFMPGGKGGMVIGGPLNGSFMPGSQGGMVIGGPLNGSSMPGSKGGMVIGGPLNGSFMPGSQGGMVIGGPLNGSSMPGSKGGMVIGGPLNGSFMP